MNSSSEEEAHLTFNLINAHKISPVASVLPLGDGHLAFPVSAL